MHSYHSRDTSVAHPANVVITPAFTYPLQSKLEIDLRNGKSFLILLVTERFGKAVKFIIFRNKPKNSKRGYFFQAAVRRSLSPML